MIGRSGEVSENEGDTTMNVPLSEYWEEFIRSRVQSGRYASEAALLEDALLLLSRRELEQLSAKQPAADEGEKSPRKPFWEVSLEIAASIPDEEWAKLPVDGAEQHDHYIYGTPKRPTTHESGPS